MSSKQDLSVNNDIAKPLGVLIVGISTLDIIGIGSILRLIENVTILETIKSDNNIFENTLRIKPDILIWHINSARYECIQVINNLSYKLTSMRIVCILPKTHPRALNAFMNSGCHACILVDTVELDLRLALDYLEQGHCWVSPIFTHEPCFPSNILCSGDVILNKQELAIAKLLIKGYRNYEISDNVGLTTKSVERYLTILYSKLNVRSKAEAVAILVSEGITISSCWRKIW
jgi:two-component system competent response regulator ComA